MPSQQNSCSQRLDYFTILPPSYRRSSVASTTTLYDSPIGSPTTEVPCSPGHPLLAYRDQDRTPTYEVGMSNVSNLMNMQTSAAHGYQSTRPRPHPVQNVLHVTSDDCSSSSDSSSSSLDSMSTPNVARCSRCQRTQSLDVQTGKNNMVSYGLNSWYCSRCAAMVGLIKR